MKTGFWKALARPWACLGAGLALLMSLAVAPTLQAAEAFPTKPITLILPFPPGGATDVQLRALALAAQRELGQPIVIDLDQAA